MRQLKLGIAVLTGVAMVSLLTSTSNSTASSIGVAAEESANDVKPTPDSITVLEPPRSQLSQEPSCSPPPEFTTNAHGDNVVRYDLGRGLTLISVIPAKPINPATAPLEVLDRYPVGRRPDPKDPGYEDWVTSATAALEGPGKLPATLCSLETSASTLLSTNWNGFVGSGTSSSYDAVSSSYTAPALPGPPCVGSSLGDWVGITDTSGGSSAKLIQAGLFYDTQRNRSGGFFEFVNGTWDTTEMKEVPVDWYSSHRYYMHLA